MAIVPAYVTQGTAALPWYVANTSFFVPQGTVVAGGGTIGVAMFVQQGVTCVQGGAADPLFAGFPAAFTQLSVPAALGPGGVTE